MVLSGINASFRLRQLGITQRVIRTTGREFEDLGIPASSAAKSREFDFSKWDRGE